MMGVLIAKKLQRGVTVPLSGDISVSEERPHQLERAAAAGGRTKGFRGVFFRTKEFLFSVILLFLKKLLCKYDVVLLGL